MDGVDIKGRSILVTGASSGIGAHFTKILAHSRCTRRARRAAGGPARGTWRRTGRWWRRCHRHPHGCHRRSFHDQRLAYSATKAAVEQMGRALAKDWAEHGINVNIIAPGYMLTDLTEQTLSSERGRAIIDGFPRGRLLDTEALDTMLLYLCSHAARQVTGSVMTIDDGQRLWPNLFSATVGGGPMHDVGKCQADGVLCQPELADHW